MAGRRTAAALWTSSILLATFLCYFSIRLVGIRVEHPYSSIDTTAAWKKLHFILSFFQEFNWNTNDFVQDLNSDCRFHFSRNNRYALCRKKDLGTSEIHKNGVLWRYLFPSRSQKSLIVVFIRVIKDIFKLCFPFRSHVWFLCFIAFPPKRVIKCQRHP